MQLASAMDTVISGLSTAGSTAGFAYTPVTTLVGNTINVVLSLLGIAAICFVIYAGYLYMMSKGETKDVEEAKKVLIYAILGMLIIVSSYVISNFILGALGVLLAPTVTPAG